MSDKPTVTTLNHIDKVMEDMFTAECPEFIQISLDNYRQICWKENISDPFIAETASVPGEAVVQLSKENGASILVDNEGYVLRFA